jgi:hypothetical protein
MNAAVNDRKVDRVLALHQDLTAGEVGAARARFSELMYRVGETAFGPGKCWRPDWESLLPYDPRAAEEVRVQRFLGFYPQDMVTAQGYRPVQDIRETFACFERINEARKRAASLDEHLLVSLLGYPVIWWNLLCGRLDSKAAAQRYSLSELASWMEEKGWRSDARNAHRKTPEINFPGHEERVSIPTLFLTSPDRAAYRPDSHAREHTGRLGITQMLSAKARRLRS